MNGMKNSVRDYRQVKIEINARPVFDTGADRVIPFLCDTEGDKTVGTGLI
jgi:hypothetical protein